MKINDWPLEDRPREKILSKGGVALTNAELLAIVIQTGSKGVSALDLAKKLLQTYPNLQELHQHLRYRIPPQGLGRAKIAIILAAFELGRRLQLQGQTKTDILNTYEKSKSYLALRLQHHANEVFACLFLDNRLRVIKYEELFHGTINEANVYPREILRRGLLMNAAKLILAHNHPSGNATPSNADLELTNLIKRTLSLVDIQLVDHIIIGAETHFSFAEAALLGLP